MPLFPIPDISRTEKLNLQLSGSDSLQNEEYNSKIEIATVYYKYAYVSMLDEDKENENLYTLIES